MINLLLNNIYTIYVLIFVAGSFMIQYIWFLDMKNKLNKEQQNINQSKKKLQSERELINKEKKEASELLKKANLVHKGNLENNAKLEKKKAAYSIYD